MSDPYADLTPINMTPMERAESLDHSPWSEYLEWPQSKTLAEYMQAYEAPTGAVLMSEFDDSHGMFLLIKGTVEIVKMDSDKNQKTLYVRNPGCVLGEISMLGGGPRSASVVAKTECLVLLLTADNLDRLRRERPDEAFALMRQAIRSMANRLRQSSGQVVQWLH